jgi:MoCo/4Fe-4S cofactor protein with predicted Tat translocation signal
MENNKQYWRGLEELNPSPEFLAQQKNEFMEGVPMDEMLNENASSFDLSSNRRDFLKYFGFGIGAVALAACNNTPVKNAIPYIVKPENITPGVPNFYASTCGACATACGIVVKTREGRPIKIDGNEKTFNQGAVCAQGQASVLSLYDNNRNKKPSVKGKESDWKSIDSSISKELEEIAATSASIKIVTGTINSPSTLKAIEAFVSKYKNASLVQYDAVSSSAIINANEMCFGKAVVPQYDFSKAKVIVSFGADFLGTWISPVEYTKQWSKTRKLNNTKNMSRHIQFESGLSVTGSNADVRIPVKPSQEGLAIVSLYNEVAKLLGASTIAAPSFNVAANLLTHTAQELVNTKGASIVVSGSNDVDVQIIVNALNSMLGNIGNTVDLDNYSKQRTATDASFDKLVEDMNAGSVGGVIFMNVNPFYNYHSLDKLKSGISKVKLSVSSSYSNDETAQAVSYVCPDSHYLESWNDYEPKAGKYQLAQPTITTVFETRQSQESLLKWSGVELDYYTFIKENWKNTILAGSGSFITSWNQALHDGLFYKDSVSASARSLSADVAKSASSLTSNTSKGIEVQVYTKVSIGDGSQANNPWLQEMPDPITRTTWDNYASINKTTADNLKLKDGSIINVTIGNDKITNLPVMIQPGQVKDTISVALGYGQSEKIGKVASTSGKNAYGFRNSKNGNTISWSENASVEKVGEDYAFARTQTHHTIEGRAIVKETTLDRWTKDATSGNHGHAHIVSLWDEKDYKGHRWAMAIDLNACTGCGACVIACQAENNVAVLGKEEVTKGREMHWIRIDRYYSFNAKKDGKDARITRETEYDEEKGGKLVQDWENVSVVYQPVMCQHCTHASCETVCPVLATTHSSEGLNQMTYNRCIGTKYCANNCAYKVRRFNYFRYFQNDRFDFNMNNDLGRMVLNPDVTVRSRGVMEKCSFCVQRINLGKLVAKREGRELAKDEVKTACQVACPADAIVFGDRNNPESEIAKLFTNEREYALMTDDEKAMMKPFMDVVNASMTESEKDNVKRAYALLEEINVKPSVKYLTKVRNRADKAIDNELENEMALDKPHGEEHSGKSHGEEHNAPAHH